MSEAVKEVPKKERPEFRNIHITDLYEYRLPPAGHGIDPAPHQRRLMFLLLPFVLYLLEQSLRSEMTFDISRAFAAHPLVKLIILALIWAYLQHFCAGVRHLFMDMHMGLKRIRSRQSGRHVLVVSLVLTAAGRH
jgi:succinate dehydrogenase / fumarate reductase cytochrome b subunit